MTGTDIVLERKLRTLLDIRNSLASCDSIRAVAARAAREARKRLRSQVASIFLFDKYGFLTRVWIEGFDADGRPLSNDWFAEEKYKPGESFTGRAVTPAKDSAFGRPQWSNNLEADRISESSARKYRNKLGHLTCAIAVPLSGRHRTFGVLEIINKWGSEEGFSNNNVYWLSVIGNSVGTRISQLRQENELRSLAEISRLLVKPFGEAPDHGEAYHLIAQKLTGPLTYYRACIIRTGEDELVTAATAGDNIDWSNFLDSPLRLGAHPAGKTLQTGSVCKIENLQASNETFFNHKWIYDNGFRSYICLPLSVGDKIIGTLSLFLSFVYRFYDNDEEFLQNVAFLIATYSESRRVIEELESLREETEEQQHKDLSTSRMIGYELARHERIHRYKNDFQALVAALQKVQSEATPAREREQIITSQIVWLEGRLAELKEELSESAPVEVNINYVIQSVWKTVSRQAFGRRVKFEVSFERNIPKLLVHEGEIKEIVYNLVNNAVWAVREAGRPLGLVEISTAIVRLSGIDYAEIKVADNGAGIPDGAILRIFDRGFTTRKGQGGTGLGLFLTKKLVEERYSGQIVFDTIAGQGTTFTVRLPLKRLMPQRRTDG